MTEKNFGAIGLKVFEADRMFKPMLADNERVQSETKDEAHRGRLRLEAAYLKGATDTLNFVSILLSDASNVSATELAVKFALYHNSLLEENTPDEEEK